VALGFTGLADHQQGIVFELVDPGCIDTEFLTDFAEGVTLAVPHAGAHAKDVNGAVVEIRKLTLSKAVEGDRR